MTTLTVIMYCIVLAVYLGTCKSCSNLCPPTCHLFGFIFQLKFALSYFIILFANVLVCRHKNIHSRAQLPHNYSVSYTNNTKILHIHQQSMCQNNCRKCLAISNGPFWHIIVSLKKNILSNFLYCWLLSCKHHISLSSSSFICFSFLATSNNPHRSTVFFNFVRLMQTTTDY